MSKRFFLSLFVVLCLASLTISQETPAPSSAEPEHKFLHQFVGEWDAKSEGTTGPGQPPIECTGEIRSRMLGELWVVSDASTEIGMGIRIEAVQTIGYDPKTKKYVGTWVDSVMNHMWKYEGTVEGKTLTLEAEGPNFEDPNQTAKYRDVYEFKSKDQYTQTSQLQDSSGKWTTFMTGTVTRKK